MLTSLVLSLAVDAPVVLPRFCGRATHALLLRLIAERDATLAADLHDAPGPRPFTCSELIGGRGHSPQEQMVLPESPAWIRYTGLTGAVSAQLEALAESPPAAVELVGARLAVASATVHASKHPWAGVESYEALCERALHRPRPSRRLDLRHASPTTFRSQEVNLPVPLPYLVFGSLLSRWQAFSPVALSPDAQRYAEEMVALSRYRLETRMVRLEGRGPQVGFVGESSMALLNADRYWGNVLGLLAEYSFYAGLGAHTTMGMGQTLPMPPGER